MKTLAIVNGTRYGIDGTTVYADAKVLSTHETYRDACAALGKYLGNLDTPGVRTFRVPYDSRG